MLKKSKKVQKHTKNGEIFTSSGKGTFIHATIGCMKGLKYALRCINLPASH